MPEPLFTFADLVARVCPTFEGIHRWKAWHQWGRLDKPVGRLYVGQAGGETGFWGRRRAYADRRTGNVAIDPAFAAGELRPESTTLSILGVVPRGAFAKVLLDRLEVR